MKRGWNGIREFSVAWEFRVTVTEEDVVGDDQAQDQTGSVARPGCVGNCNARLLDAVFAGCGDLGFG